MYHEFYKSSQKHCCDNFLYDSRSMFASKEQKIDPTSINNTFGLIYMAVTALVILSLVIGQVHLNFHPRFLLNFRTRFIDCSPKTYNIFRFLSWRLYKKDTEKTKRAKESSNASMLPSKRPSSNLEGLTDPYYGHECCIQKFIII